MSMTGTSFNDDDGDDDGDDDEADVSNGVSFTGLRNNNPL